MSGEKSVVLTLVSGTDDEYIIKDLLGITLGRIFIIELNNKNKYCMLRIKFYKHKDNNYDYLFDTIQIMLMTLFKKMNLKKVNIVVDEEINIEPFMDLGLELEGFLQNNIIADGKQKSELIFGIDVISYEQVFFVKKLTLKGINIQLKILTPEYCEDMLEYCIRNKEHLRLFEPNRDESYYTLEYQRKNLIEDYKQFLNGRNVSFGIFKNDNLIGKVKISNIVMGVFRSGFIGYSIDKEHQGKGYMKEAVNIAINYAFNEMELHRIEASVLVDNIRSQRVLKACGFKELGINEKYLFINGKWQDHVTYYKLK
ncbi:putative ribosomal N-acetyltransferase YdaF [Clostridium tepidiprofundi DSM 19306]|uniref:Putative ribosomal N-acetyltransferase YdaF n=1 Tax=Clostridium tepidiprofundi DSM 19306 TaxID=1121338 RepID=A0A151AVU3_9CLOT|nr:GNAT family protein [Clostridium tepidiprofundi]KYH31670.1 putative ribosomal N-acetyltransferase YdaF [Clostridium tepidiprofundi DSM 19306]